MEIDVPLSSQDVYKTLSGPLDAQIELNSACNNYCLHCYNHWRGAEFKRRNATFPNSSMSPDNIRSVVDTLASSGVFNLVFTGGEPLIKGNELLEGIQLARMHNINCSVNSNLTLLTPELARR